MSGMTKVAMAFVCAGVCGSAYGQNCNGQWLSSPAGFDAEIWALTSYQGDLVIAGDFKTAPGIAVKNAARWNGATWAGMNADLFITPSSLFVQGGTLYLGGSFRTPVSPATGVARWSGTSWEALPQALPTKSLFSRVSTLGEYQGKLVAGGNLQVASSKNDAAFLWDGVNWQSAGAVLGSSNNVTTMAVYLGDLYIAGPLVQLSADAFAGNVLRYDGTTWKKVGSNGLKLNGSSAAMRVYQGKLIVASQNVLNASSFLPYGPIVSWDGTTASSVGSTSEIQGNIRAMTEYHGDLIVGGSFTDAFGVGANGVVRWNGTNFAALGQGIVGTSTSGRRVNCLDVYQDELIAGGDFTTAGGMSSPYFARWTDNPTPWVAIAPESTPVNQGLILTLTAAAASGYPGVTYKWQRNGADISNGAGGASVGGGTVSGASGTLVSPSDGASITLTVAGVQASDAGGYTIVFDNTCNTAISDTASIAVNTCLGDLNADGLVNDADFELFAAAYNKLVCDDPSMPIGCPADLNGDALVDDLDFQTFVVAYDQLVCE
ncbi:MAG: hypothetical protein ACREJD_17865 [Phycisphaerales bacterium]